MKFSEMNSYQKLLFVLSILTIISAVSSIILGLAVFGTSNEVAQEVADYSANELKGMGIGVGLAGIISLITGILGIRGAKDITKIKPVYILAAIATVLGAVSVVTTIMQGQMTASYAFSFGATLATFFAAYKLNQENNANKA